MSIVLESPPIVAFAWEPPTPSELAFMAELRFATLHEAINFALGGVPEWLPPDPGPPTEQQRRFGTNVMANWQPGSLRGVPTAALAEHNRERLAERRDLLARSPQTDITRNSVLLLEYLIVETSAELERRRLQSVRGPRSGPRVDVDNLKRVLRIHDVCERQLGRQVVRTGDRWKCQCPLGTHDDRSASFVIYHDGSDFHCFACGAGGDVLSLAQAMAGGDFRSGLELARRWAGGQF